jgi:hypothetical protein
MIETWHFMFFFLKRHPSVASFTADFQIFFFWCVVL